MLYATYKGTQCACHCQGTDHMSVCPDSLESWEGPRAMSSSLARQNLSRRPLFTCRLGNAGKGRPMLKECGVRDLRGSLVIRGHTRQDKQGAVPHPPHAIPRDILRTGRTPQRAREQTKDVTFEVLDPRYIVGRKGLLPPRWM